MMYLAKDNNQHIHTPSSQGQVSAAIDVALMVVEALFKKCWEAK